MFESVKSGDLVVLYKRGFFGTKPHHICIAVGEGFIYESTEQERPPCVRTDREEPKGVQAHRLSSIVDGAVGYDVWHLRLRRPLKFDGDSDRGTYLDEEDRLLEVLESCLAQSYEFVGGNNPADLVVKAWTAVGIMTHRPTKWTPAKLVRYAIRTGIAEWGERLSA